jgi:hypothetical protein
MNLQRSIPGLYGASIPKSLRTLPVTVGTSSTVIVPVSLFSLPPQNSAAGTPYRSTLTFINPGSINVFFAQTLDVDGNPIVATLGGAGMMPLPGGSAWVIDIPGPGEWIGIAVSATGITILEYIS